jgi:tryptophan synthase alpha chain
MTNEGLAPRVRAAIAAPRAGRAALIPYLTGGHPDRVSSHLLVEAVIDAGADVVELGVPFSDPVADGPVVQRSTHDALQAGTTPDHVFELAAAHRDRAPVVLLAYLNSVLARGAQRFFSRAAEAGVEALVIPDLPLETATGPWPPGDASSHNAHDARSLLAMAADNGVALVPMATPTSTDEHLDLVASSTGAFVYCVAVIGVTGARQELGAELPALAERLRARTAAPLAAGFGISTLDQAARAARLADGVIVGSALIDVVSRAPDVDEAAAQARRLVASISGAIAGR